jgi:MFS family permease
VHNTRRTDITRAHTSQPASELTRGWSAVLACFFVAVFAWGFGFYGQSVYLAELERTRGWSASVISAATTSFYLAGALLLTRLHVLVARFDPGSILASGVILLAIGTILFSLAISPWQLYPAAMIMAAGWACSSGAAITTTLGICFEQQRGLAISLALNGASAAGFTVAPLLVTLSRRGSLTTAVLEVGAALLAVVLPLIGVGLRRAATATRAPTHSAIDASDQTAYVATAAALVDWHFWSVTLPFALALAAQVGFIIHLVALMLPHLGAHGAAIAVSITSVAALAGRTLLGLVIDRLQQRAVSAASFASQAASLALMLTLPGHPLALYFGCLIFGASVGNVITLPALIIQREFAPASFALVIGLSTAVGQFTFAFAPVVLGIIRDIAGRYGPALGICIACELVAAALILRRPRPQQALTRQTQLCG